MAGGRVGTRRYTRVNTTSRFAADFALRGSGVLRVDGGEIPLEPGRYVLVGPQVVRQVVAGPAGLSHAVAGAVV